MGLDAMCAMSGSYSGRCFAANTLATAAGLKAAAASRRNGDCEIMKAACAGGR